MLVDVAFSVEPTLADLLSTPRRYSSDSLALLDTSSWDLHAPYIRTLGEPDYSQSISGRSANDIFQNLEDVLAEKYANDGPLTPHLEHPVIWPLDDVNLCWNRNINLFMPDKLIRLDIFTAPEPQLEWFHSLAHATATRTLRHLAFAGDSKLQANSFQGAQEMLRDSRNLETLSWDIGLPLGSLEDIAGFSRLCRLSLRLSSPNQCLIRSPLPPITFPVLQFLPLNAVDEVAMSDFMRCVRTAPLSAVIIGRQHRARTKTCHNLDTLIHELRKFHSDTSIHLQVVSAERLEWLNLSAPYYYTTPSILAAPLAGRGNDHHRAETAPGPVWARLRTVKVDSHEITGAGLLSLISSTLHELEIDPSEGTPCHFPSYFSLPSNVRNYGASPSPFVALIQLSPTVTT